MKRIIFLLFLAPLLINKAYGQTDAAFSQYMLNTLYYNPGYAGVEGVTKIKAVHRTQWAGYSADFDNGQGGAPTTQVVSLSTPILKYRSGIGFHVVNDNAGPLSALEAQLSYAYQLSIDGVKLSLGARIGAVNLSTEQDRYRFNDPDDPLILGAGETTIKAPDVAVGAYLRAQDYYVGISANHLTNNDVNIGTSVARNKLPSSMYLTGGFDYEMTYKLMLTPSALIRVTDFQEYQYEIGAIGTYDENFYTGLSYRQSEAAVIMLGYGFLENQALQVGYSFDYVIQERDAKESTSHEIVISYSIPVISADDKKIIRTPRFRQ